MWSYFSRRITQIQCKTCHPQALEPDGSCSSSDCHLTFPHHLQVCGQTLTVLTNWDVSLCTRSGEQAAQGQRTSEKNICTQLSWGTRAAHTNHTDLKLTWNDSLQFHKLKCSCAWFKPRQKVSFQFPRQNICTWRHWEGAELAVLDDQMIHEIRLTSILHLMEFIVHVFPTTQGQSCKYFSFTQQQ